MNEQYAGRSTSATVSLTASLSFVSHIVHCVCRLYNSSRSKPKFLNLDSFRDSCRFSSKLLTACNNKKHVKFQNALISSQLNRQTYQSLIANLKCHCCYQNHQSVVHYKKQNHWDKIEPTKPGYKLELKTMVDLDCYARTKKMCLNARLSHMVHTNLAIGIHVHHVKQRKIVKLSKVSHPGPSSLLICISMLLHNTSLPLNPIIPQQILGFWSATSWMHSCQQTKSQTWPFVSPA